MTKRTLFLQSLNIRKKKEFIQISDKNYFGRRIKNNSLFFRGLMEL